VEISMNMVKAEQMEKVQKRAQEHAEERVLDLLLPKKRVVGSLSGEEVEDDAHLKTREKLRGQLREGMLDNRFVEVDVKEKHMPFGLVSGAGMEDLEINLKEMLGNILPDKPKRRKVKVPEAMRLLMDEEASRLIDMEKVTRDAVERAEQLGLVFIDEVDKVAGKQSAQGPDVSREGVQRDLLPIVEGSTVSTKYGPVRTEHVLFIAAGAFHTAKPSDLIPELQGRFPIRVELDHLGKDEFVRILKEPDNSLTKQYTALLGTEEVTVNFGDDAIDEIASIAAVVNEKSENIGARRLQTVMEKLLEEVSFHAPDMKGTTVDVDREMVTQRLADIVKDEDLSKYIL
jgi:ATP-dependent HslUV protease ATP-binding subunit HslU